LRRFVRFTAVVALLLLVRCKAESPPLVHDGARLFTDEQSRALADQHHSLAADHGIDYRVITGRGFGDIDRHAAETFAQLGIGELQAAKRGLLLIVDAQAGLLRLEVGYGLEGVFPDAFVAYVEARQMVPFFQAARVADGILATTELIVGRVQRAKAGGGYEGEVWFAGSGGGGAKTKAEIGAGYERPAPRATASTRAGRSPAETLAAYLAAMEAHDAAPDSALYTPETRTMLAGWVMTRAQMDNVVRTYRGCGTATERRDSADALAVVRYPIANRQCAPWFFRRSGDDWQLDLTMMQTAIRFGRDNSWRLLPGAPHPYGFAFEDWRFDGNGFPVE
jgi:uncharacterized protein